MTPIVSSSAGGGGSAAPSPNPFRPPAVTELEAVLASYRLRFSQITDREVELTRFPSMVGVFADECFHLGGFPPTQQAFVDAFVNHYWEAHPTLFLPHLWPGTEARLLRAYPSLVRDLHLACLLREAGLAVIQTPDADERLGIDVLVLHASGYAVRLNCFLDSQRGRAFRAQKLRRRPPQGLSLELPLDRADARRIGDFDLFGPRHVAAILFQISTLVDGKSSPRTKNGRSRTTEARGRERQLPLAAEPQRTRLTHRAQPGEGDGIYRTG